MITLLEAFGWLNWGNGSHISPENSEAIRRISHPRQSQLEQNWFIDELIHCSWEFTDLSERAEVLAYCSVQRYQQGKTQEASRLMLDARQIYEDLRDLHRYAVTAWCLFIIRYRLLENQHAFSSGRKARALFMDRISEYLPLVDEKNQDLRWYRDRVAEMNCDLIATPEEAFEWITKYSGDHLSTSANLILNRTRKLIEDKCFDDAYVQMESLRRITKRSIDPLETAEALAFCGLSLYEMGNRVESIRNLRSAMANAIPVCHEHTAIRWMLGLVQLNLPSERSKGIINLEECLSYFKGLRVQADHENNQSAVAWYGTQLPAMRQVLDHLIRVNP